MPIVDLRNLRFLRNLRKQTMYKVQVQILNLCYTFQSAPRQSLYKPRRRPCRASSNARDLRRSQPGQRRTDSPRSSTTGDRRVQSQQRFQPTNWSTSVLAPASTSPTIPLPLGDAAQTPDDYVKQVSATTGLPYVLARRNMLKIKSMFANMESVLNGLTRNIDWEILDRGFGEFEGRALSFFPRTQSLGAVLPNNSPGVHSLWIPAFPLRIPLVLKPGSAEPWTPYRIIQSLIKAGAPREAFSFYPTDHAGAGEICVAAAVRCCSAIRQRPACGPTIRASRYTDQATARSSSAKIASTTGSNIST